MAFLESQPYTPHKWPRTGRGPCRAIHNVGDRNMRQIISRYLAIIWLMAALSLAGWLLVNLDTAGWIILIVTIGIMVWELTTGQRGKRGGTQ
jgi:hypothetical protein